MTHEMTKECAADHGLSEVDMAETLTFLGIRDHTDEDCRVSAVLYKGIARLDPTGGPLMVDGDAAWVLEGGQAWTRYRIEAGTRRHLLAGLRGRVSLLPWTNDA